MAALDVIEQARRGRHLDHLGGLAVADGAEFGCRIVTSVARCARWETCR